MNYSKIKKYDATNWTGINTTIFFSGCGFKCPGCFNSDIQDFNVGKRFTDEVVDEFIEYANSNHVSGICILGGEPFQQDLDILFEFVVRLTKEVNKPIHIWSGYTFEELMEDCRKVMILEYCETLVDGQFILEKKDLNLKHRGSSNQRVLDTKASILKGEPIQYAL